MPYITLRPTAVEFSNWLNQGGADQVDSVYTDDDDAKYIYTEDMNKTARFTHGGMPPAASITSHYIRNKCRRSAGANGTKINNLLYYAGNTSDEDKGAPAANYTNYTSSNLAVPGGGTWTSGIVNATKIGISTWFAGGDQIRDTYMYWSVTYVPISGGYMWLLAGWLPPLIAMASHCLSKSDILTVLSSLKVQPSSREDFARIIEAFRRRPVWA